MLKRIEPTDDLEANLAWVKECGLTANERWAVETFAPMFVNAGDLRELLLGADIHQEADLLRYLGLGHRADLCDILDAWDDAGPVKRTTILTILGGE